MQGKISKPTKWQCKWLPGFLRTIPTNEPWPIVTLWPPPYWPLSGWPSLCPTTNRGVLHCKVSDLSLLTSHLFSCSDLFLCSHFHLMSVDVSADPFLPLHQQREGQLFMNNLLTWSPQPPYISCCAHVHKHVPVCLSVCTVHARQRVWREVHVLLWSGYMWGPHRAIPLSVT